VQWPRRYRIVRGFADEIRVEERSAMKTSWSEETRLSKAAAGFAIIALISLALWCMSVYLIHGDGDTYPGGALGAAAIIGLGGTAVAVGGLVVICMVVFVRLTVRAFRQRGER
jgi:hypothetical protein